MSEAERIANNLLVTARAKHSSLLHWVVLWGLFWLCTTPAANGVDPNRKISQYGHTAWRVQDGAVARASTITQTTDGYMWLGTTEGLRRFDGVRFVRWQSPEGQKLPGRNFTALLGSRDGSLWIGTGMGLSRLKDGRLRVFTDLTDPVGIGAIIEDNTGTVWVTRYRLHGREGPLCSVTADTLRCFGKRDGIPVPYGLGLTQDSTGNFWFGSNVLCRWRPGTRATTYFGEVSDKPGKGGEINVVDVAVSPSGTAWASLDATGPEFGVRHYAGGNWTRYVVPGFDGPKTWSHALFLDRQKSLWVGTENDGIYRIHDGVADHYAISDGLSGNSVELFYEDREGNMWVLTEGGVDIFRNTPVISYTLHQGLSTASLWSILALRDGSVWLGNEGGVDVLRKQGDSTLVTARELRGHGVSTMLEDHTGAVWLGVDHKLLLFHDGRFREITRHGEPFSANGSVIAIAEDTAHRIWVLTSQEGFFSIDGDKVQEHLLPKSDFGSRHFLAADQNGGVWIGPSKGAVFYYRAEQVQTVPVSDREGPIDINGLFVDTDDSVLVSTVRGLYRWKGGQMTALNTLNGLPCDAVYSAITDTRRALWIDAQCGLVRVEAGELAKWEERQHAQVAVTVFDALDGAHPQLQKPSQPISSKAADGRVWFINGTVAQVVDPNNLQRNAVPPPVFVEGLVADRIVFSVRPGLQIPALTRDLRIDYTGLSFSIPQRVRFRYMLEGHDREWQDAGTRRQAFYSDLAPRNYVFRVMACNNDGVWNKTGAALEFSVLPAYYQTAWCRFLCVIAFLAFLWAAYQVRIRQFRNQEKKLRDVIETMPTFAWSALPDGSEDFVNRHWHEYSGLSAEQSTGSGWQAAVHPADLKLHLEKWRTSLATGEPFLNEVRYRRTDGQYRWFLARAVPLRDERGKILKWYGISTDIEDRKRAEQEREQLRADLAHVNRVTTMGELTASLAHEIKQPITASILSAQTCLQWLQADHPDLQEACAASKRTVEAGRRACDIIDRLRSLYKKTPPLRELVDVNEIIREMVMLLRDEAARYAVSIRPDFVVDLPSVYGDRVQLQQVLMNIMVNGIEAMKATSGVLAVKSELDQDGRVLISISDTGVGLPTNNTDQIFNAFFTTKSTGSGMGLAISRSIVESHDGRLWATGNGGRGAIFHFTLPTAAPRQS